MIGDAKPNSSNDDLESIGSMSSLPSYNVDGSQEDEAEMRENIGDQSTHGEKSVGSTDLSIHDKSVAVEADVHHHQLEVTTEDSEMETKLKKKCKDRTNHIDMNTQSEDERSLVDNLENGTDDLEMNEKDNHAEDSESNLTKKRKGRRYHLHADIKTQSDDERSLVDNLEDEIDDVDEDLDEKDLNLYQPQTEPEVTEVKETNRIEDVTFSF